MNNFPKYFITLFCWAAVVYPLWIRFSSVRWHTQTLAHDLFPFFGMIAFSLLWLHALAGVFEPWLKKHIQFDRFVTITASIILACLILHPLLLLVDFSFKIFDIYQAYNYLYLWLGICGWVLLITYDIGKFLKKKYNFFERHWQDILTISTIGFLLTFFHSLYMGSDLQSGLLRQVWLFYGITAILATIYTYGIKRFLINKS